MSQQISRTIVSFLGAQELKLISKQLCKEIAVTFGTSMPGALTKACTKAIGRGVAEAIQKPSIGIITIFEVRSLIDD